MPSCWWLKALLHLQPLVVGVQGKGPRGSGAALLHVPVLGLLWQQLKNGHVVE